MNLLIGIAFIFAFALAISLFGINHKKEKCKHCPDESKNE